MPLTLIIIIVTAFKGTVRDFLQSPSMCRELSPTRTLKWPRHNHVKITCNTSSVYHVQRDVCHLVRRDSSAIKFDIAFILALLYWLKPLTNEGGEETGAPRENPWRRALENATYYSPKIQASTKTRTCTLALVAGKESRRANRYTKRRVAMHLDLMNQFLWNLAGWLTYLNSTVWY